MEKIWKNNGDGRYSLYLGERLAGVLTMDSSAGSRATATIEGKTYTIRVKGFWGSEILIADSSGKEVIKLSPITWYSSKYHLYHNGVILQLEIRNNPLAELVLSDDRHELLSYGLNSSGLGRVGVKIGGSQSEDILYDFLLWYLFMPVAQEQSGENPIFTVLS
ncbi:hypothetical protein AAEO56_01210 [Flavobacterium sp. DGU11]|uniref:Uncharacterized protein n=1 Tax=Flavobacterium arundinis TaxID=3139143 RepID=A0ABU9HS04_9FLAO